MPEAKNLPGGVATAYEDHFAADSLPPRELWPEFNRMNCGKILLDDMAANGHRDRPVLHLDETTWSYGELEALSNRIARVLTEDLELVPGNRVLLRAANTPKLVATWFGVLKAGGICVATMRLLRARELTYVIEKAQVSHALCDLSLAEDMEAARGRTTGICRHLMFFSTLGDNPSDCTLDAAVQDKPADFTTCDTAADDTALIAFTSGTTGMPKAVMHSDNTLLANARAMVEDWGHGPETVLLSLSPLSHHIAWVGLAQALAAGGEFVVDDPPPGLSRLDWIVESDPRDPESMPGKRTALGRFTHEGGGPGHQR